MTATIRVTKRRAETRSRLLAAAFDVFAAKGFGHVRIEDVCAAAGYTRGAFYSQFGSLDELFLAMYEARATATAAQVADALDGFEASGKPIGAVVKRVVATLSLDRDWLLVLTDFRLYAARHPEVAEQLAAHRANLEVAIAHQLARAREALHLPAALRSVNAAARAIITAYDGVAVQLLLDRDEAKARARLTQLATALLDR
jgi:AcrR family transcriptional regulator